MKNFKRTLAETAYVSKMQAEKQEAGTNEHPICCVKCNHLGHAVGVKEGLKRAFDLVDKSLLKEIDLPSYHHLIGEFRECKTRIGEEIEKEG